MLSTLQEILVFREDSAEPSPVLWDDLCTEFGEHRDWLKEVERALLEDECWVGDDRAGPRGIVKVALSERWQA